MGRNDDPAHPEMGGDAAGMGRAGAAAGKEGKVAGIVPLEHHFLENLLAHVRVNDPADARGGLHHIDAQGTRYLLFNGHAAQIRVKQNLAAQVVVRVQIAQHQIGIGNRRFMPALVVTGGPGHGSRRLRADLQGIPH